jgi:tetratricopeptide (TPR) repeat protein
MPPTPTVFISYSHKDEVWKDRLVQQLAVLENQGLLATWDDRRIKAGDEWHKEIEQGMQAAKVAVFLVSVHSLTSRFILDTEIPHLLERRERDGMVVFPVVCGDCLWEEVPWLAKLQARPRDGRPLASFGGNRINAELKKIAKEILEIARNGAPSPQPPAQKIVQPSPALAPLHQLPTPPADFTGRQEDLDFLRSHLAPGKTGAIFGLRGMGGVGKTTLALKLAAELKPEFPDAQIYLHLKGVDPNPLTTAQAMAHVIRSFHPEARLPEGDAEVAGLYRTVLDGKRVLLLMDNAAGKEQIQPLIPPPTCLLLVTSRFHFALPGLVDRDLEEMSETEARGLLLRIAPRIGDAAGEIGGLCGRLPLALRLAGSALAERRSLSPTEYVRRLKEGKERFDGVDASLNLSYELLDEERRRLWRLLAVFPGSFDGKAAAAVWELDPEAAEDRLDELVRISLVDLEEQEVRHRLHDLARSFAEKCLEAAEREIGQRRLSEHFLRALGDADDLYLQGGDSIPVALKTFDTEWRNIQAGHAWAARHAQEEEAAARICSKYPDTGTFLLELRQSARERIRWRELGIAAARQHNDRAAEGTHLGNLGLAYAELGETRRAIELYEQRLAIAREIGSRHGESQTLGNLGLAYAVLGDPRRAIELYEQALVLDREIGDRRGEGADLGNLGIVYGILGETQRAIEFFEQALTIDREVGDRRGEGNALGNMGIAYKKLGETRRSIELYEQVLIIDREIGDRQSESLASWHLGLAYEKEGDLARAADLMQVMVDYEREIGHIDAENDASVVEALRARIAEQNP